MEIIPAIMPVTFKELEEKTFLVKDLVDFVQVDIMDGKFTKHSSWPYKKSPDPYFEAIKTETKGLPYWEELNYEFDLMTENPEKIVEDFMNAGASRIIIHVETITDWSKILEILKGKVEIGVAINITTPNELLASFAKDADFIQCMGIARIGFQGEPFDERVIEKIKEIKKTYPDKIVSVDGGVSEENIPQLTEAGATRFVEGSAFFRKLDVL
ncbi:MAG: hypothetical protein NUV47_03965 [Patescibacteria group bacterium]|nr:hypothetical protein [Patescibacteria group bacterium]